MLIGKHDPAKISTHEKLKEVETEIGFRWRVYGKRVKAGGMKQDVMDRKIAIMIGIRDELRERLEREGQDQQWLSL